MLLSSLSAFTLASAACAAAPSLVVLTAFRAIQGVAGGALIPVGIALILEWSNRERHGRAMAVWSMAGMMTPAIGPSVGGFIVDSLSWRWIFLINVPLGVCAVAAGAWALPRTGYRERRSLDWVGAGLGIVGLTTFVLGLSEGSSWGWGSAATLAALVVGALCLGFFVRWELSVHDPVIEVRMFAQRHFSLSMATLFLVTLAQFGRLIFLPLELEGLHHYSALKVGLLLLPPAFFGMSASWVGGQLVDRVGPRRPILLGCAIALVAVALLGRLNLHSSAAWMLILLCAQSAGMGLVSGPAMVAGLSDLPADLIARGSALRSLVGNASGALSVAVLGAVLAAATGVSPSPAHAQSAYNTAFLVAAGGIAIALLLATALPAKAAATLEPAHAAASK